MYIYLYIYLCADSGDPRLRERSDVACRKSRFRSRSANKMGPRPSCQKRSDRDSPVIFSNFRANSRRFARGVSKSRPDFDDRRGNRIFDHRACRQNRPSISTLPARIDDSGPQIWANYFGNLFSDPGPGPVFLALLAPFLGFRHRSWNNSEARSTANRI